MELTEAIEHMRTDLERYAASGKASPKAVAFRQLVLNTVIDGVNNMEEALVKERTLAKERIDALRADLRDRDEQLAELHSETGIEHRWSWLEGRAQRVMNMLTARVDREEGRSISAQRAASDRQALDLLRTEFDKGHAHRIDLQVELNRSRALVEHLTQWLLLCGLRMDLFNELTEEYRAHLYEANHAMTLRRLADGVVDRFGNRTRRSYPNPEAVAMSVLSCIVIDARFKRTLKECGIATEEREPLWQWEPAEPTAVMQTTTALPAAFRRHYQHVKAAETALKGASPHSHPYGPARGNGVQL